MTLAIKSKGNDYLENFSYWETVAKDLRPLAGLEAIR
jgi:hypothetical protein